METLWRDFLSRVDAASASIAPEYLASDKGGQRFAVLALADGRVGGILSGVRSRGHIRCGLPSRPQVCLDQTVDSGIVEKNLWAGLMAAVPRAELIDVFAWQGTPLHYFEERGFKGRRIEANVVLDLKLGAQALFRQFHETRKRNIRAALRHGVEVSQAETEDDAAAYYAVFSAWQKTARKQIRSKETLAEANAIQNRRNSYRRFLARYQGKVIAATTVRFYPGGLMEYVSNCSLDEHIQLRPNDLLLWRTVEWACEQGFSKYSLGASHAFLRKFGGSVVPTFRYRLDRSFLRRYHLEDTAVDVARKLSGKMPKSLATAIKKILRRPGA